MLVYFSWMLIDWNTTKIKAPTNNTHYMVYQDDIEMTEHWVNYIYLMFLVLKYVQNFSKTLVGVLGLLFNSDMSFIEQINSICSNPQFGITLASFPGSLG